MEKRVNKKEKLAYALAEYAHDGQMYGDHDYFQYHVLGVASQFQLGSDEHIVALLHDVVEDSDISVDIIDRLFGTTIGCAVLYITNNYGCGKSYLEKYIPQLKRNDISTKVKIADLKFHLSQPELKNESKYRKALAVLESES